MKRFFVAILALLYMVSTTGATIYIHYCMGEQVGASLAHHDEHHCSKCGMKRSTSDNGCCKDENKTYKASDHQLAKVGVELHVPLLAVVPTFHTYTYPRSSVIACCRATPLTHAPPWVGSSAPIFIQIRNIRV